MQKNSRLKIDGEILAIYFKRSSFVAYADERAEKALAATIRMIKSMGMTVLAEGVEERFNLVKRLNY